MISNGISQRASRGFTLIELVAVLAIISILALMSLPSFYYRNVVDQIANITPLLNVAEAPIAAAWTQSQTFPADNASAGLPAPAKMINNYVSSMLVQDGAINVTFGNRAAAVISGKILTYRPAVVSDSPVVPVTWVCGNAAAPAGMTVKGINQTSVPAGYLPLNCK